jgi:2-hydroxymuconate-semialdehyde hydrolase
MDRKYATFESHKVHYWEGGAGFPILMLHGVGPGTSTVGNFGPVLEPLSKRFHIFAMDLIGFGGSDRSRSQPFFNVDLWVRQALALLDTMPTGPVGIIGHSMGGALALKVAARRECVTKVMTSCSVGTSYPLTEALNAFWSVPKDREDLRKTMGRMVYSTAALSDEMIDDRWKLLTEPGYPEYFAQLFAEPRQRFVDAAVLSHDELKGIKAQVVMLHGRDDQPCPPELTTVVLAKKLPRADVHLLGACGHNLPRERTADFLSDATALFGGA